MKKMLLMIITILLIGSHARAAEIQTSYANELYGISLLVDQVVKTFGSAVPVNAQNKLEILSSVLKDSYQVVSRTEKVIGEIKLTEQRGIRLRNQLRCISKTGLEDPALCTLVDCANKRVCIAATINTIKDFLVPFVDSMLGKVTTVGKEVNIEPGILLVLANSQLLPAEKQKLFKEKITDFTMKVYKAIDFLSLLSFVINPQLPITGLTEQQKQEIVAEPIVIQEEEFSFE